MSAWTDKDDEIAQLRAQVDSLSRENGALRQNQALAAATATPIDLDIAPNDRTRRRTDEGRGRGRGRGRNSTVNAINEEDGVGGRVVWVSGDSTPQSVAKQITGAALPSARQRFPVRIHAKYDQNCNTAIKGVVTAQRLLSQRHEIYVGVTPCFRANRNELTLQVMPLASQPQHLDDPASVDLAPTLSVARATDPKVLAGAIAAQARAGTLLTFRAIGAKAVYEMLRAVGVARDYLADDNLGVDLVAFPDFVEVQLDGRAEPTNALRLVVASAAENPFVTDTDPLLGD